MEMLRAKFLNLHVSIHSIAAILLLTSIALLVYLFLNEIVRYRARNHDFPGPPNRLFIGNLPDITVNAPEKLRTWASEYGEVYQIELGNIPILVVNSAEAAKELLGHHSHALSSRPTFYTFHKIVAKTAGATIGTSPISDSLKRRRRVAAAALNKPAVTSYAIHVENETSALVQDLLEAGKAGKKAIDPKPLVQRFALSMALTVNFGTRIASRDDELFREIIEVEKGIVSTRNRTQNMMDYIPLLRLVPFSARTRQAKEWRERRDVYLSKFDRELQRQIDAGTNQPSIQANAILDPETKLDRADLTAITISIIQGGTDTVAGTVNWILAFLSQRPDIQNKLYADIEQYYPSAKSILSSSIGSEQESCSYLRAFVRESLRYFTVLRLSLPRCTIQDIDYQGRRIRKGSTIWLNAWACNMDHALWKDPFEFRPERWIEQPDAPLFTYGLGYRMCAGHNLANRELYLLILRVVGCFEISAKAKIDVDPVTGSENVSEGGRSPRAYEVYFKPRDEITLREQLNEKD